MLASSIHTIHGLKVRVTVSQGDLTEQARGRCIGRVVNICREMPTEEFTQAMRELATSMQGGPASLALLTKLDDALAANYTKRYSDDFAPIASLELVEG